MPIEIYKGWKFKLDPRPMQRQQLAQMAGCCRWVWNWALSQKIAVYEAVKELPKAERNEALKVCTEYALSAQLPHLKKQFEFLAKAPSNALQRELENLQGAYTKFFKEGAGFPNFKAKNTGDSFTEKSPNCFDWNEQAVKLPKLGWVKYFNSRPKRKAKKGEKLRPSQERIQGTPTELTVTRQGNDWYVAIQTKLFIDPPPANLVDKPPKATDMGITKSMAFNDRTQEQLPVMTPEERKQERWLQRLVARKCKGSHRWWQAVERHRRFRRHITDRVQDCRHKITSQLANNHGLLFGEALPINNMVRSARGTVEHPGTHVAAKAGLNRSIQMEGWGETFRQLDYKALWNGGYFIQVPPPGTSQECPLCHHKAKENRPTQALFKCVKCGHTDNADFNATHTINDRGMKLAQELNLITADGLTVAARGGNTVVPNETRTSLEGSDTP